MTSLSAPDGRVVVVVGASSGIGRASARAFADQGARLVLASRSPVSLAVTEQECLDACAQTCVVPTDVGDAASVDALFEAAVTRFGRVDAVVHSAAVVAYGRFDDVPTEVFNQVMTTNVIGAANVSRAALRLFKSQGGGRLVLVGSLLGKIAVPLMGTYVTSKWAMQGFARVLQLEARESPGVQVSLITPGSVNTPAYTQAANYAGWAGRPPPPVDPVEKVARAVVRAVEHPRRETSVGLLNPVVVFGYRALPAVYDTLVTPLMRIAGLSWRRVAPHSGIVFAPRPGGESEHGPWGRIGLRTARRAIRRERR